MLPLFQSGKRLEMFSDGVFAIAITLLVLELKVPSAAQVPTGARLGQFLLDHWPSYFAFLLSFATILIAWIGHHLVFQEAKAVSRTLVWVNAVYLLCITVMPFTTALVAEHLLHPGGQIAAVIYAVLNAINGVAYLLLAQLVRGSSGADDPLHFAALRTVLGLGIYGAAIGMAFLSPVLSLMMVAATWIWWSLPPRADRPALHR